MQQPVETAVHTLRTWGFPLYRRGSVVRAPGYAGADRRRRGRATRRLQTVASAEFPAITGENDAGHPAVREAVLNRALTHSGDPDLARHVGNAVVKNDSHGQRIVKEHRDSTRRIDFGGCCGDGVQRGVDDGAGAATVPVRRGRRLGACGRGRGYVRLGIALPPAKPPAKPTMKPNRNATPPTAVGSSHRRLRRSVGRLCVSVVGSDMQVNLTVAKVSRPRRRPLAGRAATSRRRIVEVEFGDLPLDLVARPDRWDQDLFCAFVRSEVPQADGQVARAPYRVDLTPSG
jgi:hypothetical protein